jgi:hypothetical protein
MAPMGRYTVFQLVNVCQYFNETSIIYSECPPPPPTSNLCKKTYSSLNCDGDILTDNCFDSNECFNFVSYGRKYGCSKLSATYSEITFRDTNCTDAMCL